MCRSTIREYASTIHLDGLDASPPAYPPLTKPEVIFRWTLSLSEAAECLGYSISGFRKLLRAGKGPRFMRIAPRGHFRFREDWLAEWSEQAASAPAIRDVASKKKVASPVPAVLPFGFDRALLRG
ncbi:MAG TPA: helix-turn-helix domain-containing protein [Pirellulales bacterium]|jgi:hypothetical protein|nr:helix-turn-helix domain-containing protein [Pirellulales bacterium]